MLLTNLKWTAALVLCGLASAAVVGCQASAEIGTKTETPPPPPPPKPADDDGDGIVGDADKCPKEKEDSKPPDPADGCPTTDADGDGIPVPADKCPDQAEVVNGFEDEDGCPDEKPLVEIKGTEVKINQKIMFEKGKSTITEGSMPVVQAVADVLKKHPELQLVEVSGHASKEGDKTVNLNLTQQRVNAVVKKLVELGVEQTRLLAQGYGFYCPVAPGDSEADLEKNRRVEFKILYQEGKSTGVARGCEEAEKNNAKPKALPPVSKWDAEAAKKSADEAAAKAAGSTAAKPAAGKTPDTAPKPAPKAAPKAP